MTNCRYNLYCFVLYSFKESRFLNKCFIFQSNISQSGKLQCTRGSLELFHRLSGTTSPWSDAIKFGQVLESTWSSIESCLEMSWKMVSRAENNAFLVLERWQSNWFFAWQLNKWHIVSVFKPLVSALICQTIAEAALWHSRSSKILIKLQARSIFVYSTPFIQS